MKREKVVTIRTCATASKHIMQKSIKTEKGGNKLHQKYNPFLPASCHFTCLSSFFSYTLFSCAKNTSAFFSANAKYFLYFFYFTKHPTTSGKNTYITIYSLAFHSHSKITTTWKINPKENRNGNYIYLGKKGKL